MLIPNRPKSRGPSVAQKAECGTRVFGLNPLAHKAVAGKSDFSGSASARFASFCKRRTRRVVFRAFDGVDWSAEGRRSAGEGRATRPEEAEGSGGKSSEVCERRTRLGGFNPFGFQKDTGVSF